MFYFVGGGKVFLKWVKQLINILEVVWREDLKKGISKH